MTKINLIIMKRQFIFSCFFLFTILNGNLFAQNEAFLKRTHTNTKISNNTMPYRLFVPANYDPTKSYPMMMYLHGVGAKGNDNELQLTSNEGASTWVQPAVQSTYPCFVIAPQCATNLRWSDTDFNKGSYNQDNIPITPILLMVIDVLDSLQ